MVKPVTFFPVGFTFSNYRIIFRKSIIFTSFFISVARTVLGTLYALTITTLAAYALSKRYLPFNRTISIFLIIPMYVTGGLLPYYVLIHDLHLFNNFLVYILPHGFWAFNMIIIKTYFNSIPASLEESAKLDGANDITVLVRIVLPLSKPILATIAIFLAVWQWNSWFDAFLFIHKMKLLPLQAVLQKLLLETLAVQMAAESGNVAASDTSSQITPEAIKMATLVITTIPIVCIYPFFQKHFVRGIMIGAVKA
jgi:putative aldouronate transport system permease protein